MKKIILCLVLLCSACGKKSFQSTAANQAVSTSDTEDGILQIHQITSGGGMVFAQDNTFSAEITIGATVIASNETESDILAELGFFEILKNEF